MSDVRLRPLRPEDVDELVRSRILEAGTMGNPAPAMPEEELRSAIAERVAHSGESYRGELLLGIESDGRLVGEIQARHPDHAMPPGVYELGVALFDAQDRGRGIGRRAVARMTTRLFVEEGAHRVQAGTDLANAAMRAVLEGLGFRLEGVMRAFMPMPDEPPRDYALYGLTRDDYEDVSDRWT